MKIDATFARLSGATVCLAVTPLDRLADVKARVCSAFSMLQSYHMKLINNVSHACYEEPCALPFSFREASFTALFEWRSTHDPSLDHLCALKNHAEETQATTLSSDVALAGGGFSTPYTRCYWVPRFSPSLEEIFHDAHFPALRFTLYLGRSSNWRQWRNAVLRAARMRTSTLCESNVKTLTAICGEMPAEAGADIRSWVRLLDLFLRGNDIGIHPVRRRISRKSPPVKPKGLKRRIAEFKMLRGSR